MSLRSLPLLFLATLAATVLTVGALATPAASAACSPAPARLQAPGCAEVARDTGTAKNAARLWGSLDCQAPRRHQLKRRGGDRHLAATGLAQGNRAYRELRVSDGDNVWGERCEVGRNWRSGGSFSRFDEGDRRITFMSFRLPKRYPLNARKFQVVMQMKQTQPAANGSGSPVLSLQAAYGQWRLMQSSSPGSSSSSRELWSIPAQKRRWVRFAFDVHYSSSPNKGYVRVYVDRNGDGDALDSREQSRGFNTYTLKHETSGGKQDGLAPGASVPSHLRAGIYHDSRISCRRSSSCVVGLDNVQVMGY